MSHNTMNQYFVYILASKKNGTVYIGVTNDLIMRVWEHKNGVVEGFTKRYNVHQLVYYEQCADVREAIAREKKLKDWHRQWKVALIERLNPTWEDLYYKLIGDVDSESSSE